MQIYEFLHQTIVVSFQNSYIVCNVKMIKIFVISFYLCISILYICTIFFSLTYFFLMAWESSLFELQPALSLPA